MKALPDRRFVAIRKETGNQYLLMFSRYRFGACLAWNATLCEIIDGKAVVVEVRSALRITREFIASIAYSYNIITAEQFVCRDLKKISIMKFLHV